LDFKPLDYKKDEKLIYAIRQCASTPSTVIMTQRARLDMNRLRLTTEGVCQAIRDWIDGRNPIETDIAKDPPFTGQHIYIMSPMIDGEKRYVKVQMDRAGQPAYLMRIVSAHEYNE